MIYKNHHIFFYFYLLVYLLFVVLVLLNSAYGFGTEELAAPQATLMKMIVEGVMGGNLPWALIFIGIFIGIVVEILGIPVLPVAIGLYLPLSLSSTIMIGGLIRWGMDKIRKNREKSSDADSGILFCSGMIAGEGLIGILIAILTVCKVTGAFDLSAHSMGTVGGIVLLVIMAASVVFFAKDKKRKNNG